MNRSAAVDAQTAAKIKADFQKRQDEMSEYAQKDADCVRRKEEPDQILRSNFSIDCERILYCRYFNRYADKTQVFSLYSNDDITRRIHHVQLVSRIARNIGRMLKLNLDLIEAIALGHDLGHPPFGHAGERYLSEVYRQHTGKYFHHNLQSARILDKILSLNIGFQTLDGILCHNGENVCGEYYPRRLQGGFSNAFDEYGEMCESAERKAGAVCVKAATLEGCVVRAADVIAYLGKDRLDAQTLKIERAGDFEGNDVLGSTNSEFINRLIGNIVSNSYEKPYIKLDERYADALAHEKRMNFERLYSPREQSEPYPTIGNMFGRVYEKLFKDLRSGDQRSPVYKHHIRQVLKGYDSDQTKIDAYMAEDPNRIVADYIAGMTDDYFIELHSFLFPNEETVAYHSYFDKKQ